ncbi:cytochrome P450 [Actinokineospora globicatena]|uniref:Cytochrome P450 n=1 Tax=Actinokineospora globicatena TaxID=103729 RepID=A0A9W6V5H4_9PSEU|nr:cytochrome P450 [Actinokineospora globicatena]GLW90350.1 cytochrome P450 [Actinokineospora globicatena]
MRLTVPSGLPDADLTAVDLFDPELYATGDPHPLWLAMRERAPVLRQTLPDGRGFASVTRHADVRAVLRDHTRFTSRRGTLLSILGSDDPAGDKMMAASDPPVHTRMRLPLNSVLSFAALRSREPGIRDVVRRLLAPLAAGEPWDLAVAGAGFPMAFTGALMGLPEADWPELTRLTTMAVAPQDPMFGAEADDGSLVAAHHELFEYFAGQVQARGERDDLVGFLKRMDAGGRPLRLDEIVYNCYSLLLGANVTTPHAIAGTVQGFIDFPDEYPRLDGDPDRTTLAIEEGLRWASPANHFMRYAVADTELSGEPVRAGEAVVAWLGSANRDERVFDDPYRFDVARRPNRHVAFGTGVHYCVGAPLARVALRSLFGEVVDLVERFHPAGPPEHLKSNFVAGVRSMPVTAELRPGAADLLATATAGAGPLPELPAR